jgi:hypothetical protein
VKPPKEGDLVKACLQLLHLRGILAFRINSGAVTLQTPGARNRRFLRFVYGAVGISDIIGVLPAGCRKPGCFLALECKMPKKGRLSDNQRIFLQLVAAAGGVGQVIDSIDKLQALLDDLLVPFV